MVLGAEASFQRLLTLLFCHLLGVLVHIDRLVLYHQNKKKHLETLDKVFQIITNQNLHLNVEKTRLGTTRTEVMGFKITNRSVNMHPDQLGNTQHWEIPTEAKTIRSFLGLCNFFRGHI